MIPVFCAFLRGVNLNGRTMKMAEVCAVFTQAGMKAVSSVLTSGNLVFQSDLPKETLREQLESAVSSHYAYQANLFVKDRAEVSNILLSNPFAPSDTLHSYAFVGEAGAETLLWDKFKEITPVAFEGAAVKNGVFYWQVPKGSTLDAGFSKILARKDMREQFTSRNLNTIRKIYDRMAAVGSAS